MLAKLRSRLTFANVVSVIALFVALAGSGYAATKINGKSIKDKSISGNKLKNRTISRGKLKKHTLTGTEIDLSKLGTVPNAGHASTADNATNAAAAGNANAVGGQTVEKISWFVPANTAPRILFNAVGLKITASCDSASHIIVNASGPATNNAELQAHIDANGAFFSLGDSTFNSADSDSLTRDSTTEGSGVLAYATSDGHVATMDYGFDFNTSLPGVGCGFWGEMIYS